MMWRWGGALTVMKYSHCLGNISVISHWLCLCVCEARKNSSSLDSHLDISNSQSGPCQPGNMDQMWLIETIWGSANVLHQVLMMASCVGISLLPIIISVAIKCQVSGYLRMYLGREQHDTDWASMTNHSNQSHDWALLRIALMCSMRLSSTKYI